MNIASEVYKISMLVKSFFVESRKRFLHYGDCEIYRAERPFCNCGLLYRLNHLDYTLANIIYPEFENDVCLQETGSRRKKKITKASQKEALELLEKIFGPRHKPSFEELKMDYDDMHKVLNTLFTEKMFPSAFRRLEKWIQKEVNGS